MIKKAIFLFCLLSHAFAFSQETKLLQGKIHADSSLTDVYINIINLSGETGTVNAPSGNFEIDVAVNDSLLFSSVQYEPVKIKVSEEIFERGFLNIWLKENVNELAEVQISNIDLTGNLSTDLSNIQIFDQSTVGIAFSTSKHMAPVERHLSTAKSSPLIYLLNTLNGDLKMLKKARNNELLAMMADKGMGTMPIEFYTEDLKLPEHEIINFVYFCTESPEYESLLADPKRLELIEFYKEKAPEFIENRMGW
ncbi:hypothetical protein GCM10007103_21570 [Salinimicrobium marinum]|uniref:CarboxypepD_reg-like domain-containing protein n=1 Tax=Salinimicrobium marinum TaxID=680283 RepID=A0A918SF63_9FLAO|nr:hypothetical protein [Salinimicrobium marinum]GHA39851.1 hypothetical protein GCM10007103_21570 [Salinimicrobium marinum]